MCRDSRASAETFTKSSPTGIGDPAEDGANDAESSKKEETYPKSESLPSHLAHHERPRYENHIDVSGKRNGT